MDTFENVKKNRKKIMVIGEFALDVYHYGCCDRLSPEFPIPVLKSTEQIEYRPGCAANLAQQFKHFNVDVSLYSLIDKEAENYLTDLCFSLDTSIKTDDYKIPRKIRYYDNNNFPLLRQDIETTIIHKNHLDDLFDRIYADIDKFDAVILSNYNKGLFASHYLTHRVIDLCNKKDIITLVDPKDDHEKWSDCTIFKPNASEAFNMTKTNEWRAQCYKLKTQLNCENVIITQSSKGICGLGQDGLFEYRPIKHLDPAVSVVGGGDTYFMLLSIFILNGASIRDACKYAFEGASEYVKYAKNRPLSFYEVYKKIDPLNGKIVNLEELIYLRHNVYKNQSLNLINGSFDILHQQHVKLITYAKELSDLVVVAVNSDEDIKNRKGKDRPLNKLQDRMTCLSALQGVDFVLSFNSEEELYNIIEKLRINKLIKGNDYCSKPITGSDLTEVVFVPYDENYSSTKIINKMNT